jgi:hypothetical protein
MRHPTEEDHRSYPGQGKKKRHCSENFTGIGFTVQPLLYGNFAFGLTTRNTIGKSEDSWETQKVGYGKKGKRGTGISRLM